MGAGGAELGRAQRREMERAVATHRLAADRDPPGDGPEPPNRVGNRLAQDHRGPRAVLAIVVVAVTAAVHEHHHRRAGAEARERAEELVAEQRLRTRLRRDEPRDR